MAQLEAPSETARIEASALPIPERMWKTKDVANFLGINYQHVYRLIDEEGLPCDYIGHWVYHPALVAAWATNRQKIQVRKKRSKVAATCPQEN